MDDAPDEREIADLAYRLSLRTLNQQEAALNELRARTGTLIGAAALVASFLGGTTLARDGFTAWTAAALIGLVVSTLFSVLVVLPQSGLTFSLRGSALYEREVEDEVGIAETLRRLTYWLEGFHDGNAQRVERLFWYFRISVLALVLEIACWSVQLAID